MSFEDDDEQLSARSGGEDDVVDPADDENPKLPILSQKESTLFETTTLLSLHVECVYDDKRSKPGLRTGAVENLSQRVATLENMFLGQGVLWQQVFNCLSTATTNPNASSPGQDGSSSLSLNERVASLKSTLATLAEGGESSIATLAALPRKDIAAPKTIREEASRTNLNFETMANDSLLPEPDLMNALVEIYFQRIHPWIPMLHVRQFRERMRGPEQRCQLGTIFHAMVSLCARFSPDPRLGSSEEKTRFAKRCRQVVILNSMESFSVENLQALTIIAFDTIGSGRGPSAWSIVGSMTRTVEQLQLSVEDEDQPPVTKHLIKRMAFLPPCQSWSEREERRRVFWNIFLMDRFCSIATGWNFSLTSADVKRRLPCEGALWENGEPLQTPTPYFGVADRSSGANGALPAARPEEAAQDSLGGFAYCIEATESLSLVTSFFLQQAIDVSKPHEIQVWLMKFKQLDLRLVQWKIFLPEQWREACVLNADGIMDPNLTLAHITHNASVVLLHQGIAYPLPEWQATGIRLPSASSAETCLAAATEVGIIAEKFLQDSEHVVSPQFAFCLFICGRMLLAHSMYYNVALPNSFESLVGSLNTIASRWNGPGDTSDNLASKFAGRLIQARHQGRGMLDIRQAVYSEDAHPESKTNTSGSSQRSHGLAGTETIRQDMAFTPSRQDAAFTGTLGGSNMDFDQEASPDSISLAFPPLPLAFHAQNSSRGPTALPSPTPAALQPPAHIGSFDHFDVDVTSNRSVAPHTVGDFEDLNAYLDYSFLPNQRISMFSGATEKE
ncbi:putative transcriptional regulatory protein C530.11c-like protein 4 [Colletotrichum chlorophyti]|uniref:Putative transcriptional regulatory protein C530.11c-like protein 4 n=1 Tax=Colletotrichum chlorophyti TaxID=708187 RepID=A0A1Q8S792_9PEZI|nr:putative transcriptional regulatory protein C530.11c-like protein 4 [Colletotrichum chlorophyti]